MKLPLKKKLQQYAIYIHPHMFNYILYSIMSPKYIKKCISNAQVTDPSFTPGEEETASPLWASLLIVGVHFEGDHGQNMASTLGRRRSEVCSSRQFDGVKARVIHATSFNRKCLLETIRSMNLILNPGTFSRFRMCILIWLILAQQGQFTLEQPSTSLLFRHPRFQQIIGLCKDS